MTGVSDASARQMPPMTSVDDRVEPPFLLR
jgi:hypothetical protein